jgi:hypothetical protein
MNTKAQSNMEAATPTPAPSGRAPTRLTHGEPARRTEETEATSFESFYRQTMVEGARAIGARDTKLTELKDIESRITIQKFRAYAISAEIKKARAELYPHEEHRKQQLDRGMEAIDREFVDEIAALNSRAQVLRAEVDEDQQAIAAISARLELLFPVASCLVIARERAEKNQVSQEAEAINHD